MQGVHGASGYGGAQYRVRMQISGQARQIKCYTATDNGPVAVDEEQLLYSLKREKTKFRFDCGLLLILMLMRLPLHRLCSWQISHQQILSLLMQFVYDIGTFYLRVLLKLNAEDLKEQTTALRPIKALTVYPPINTATLSPVGCLSNKHFMERGFEQTKECYLTEVIPFFKTLKEYFEGIQKALTKEVKEMKEIFKELEAEIPEMHDAHTVVQARCLELKAELSNLCDKVQKDDHTKLVKCFSNLEVNHLNLQLKYQNLKERFGNNTSPPARHVPDFDSVFVIEKIKASIQGKDNAIKKLRMQIAQLKETHSETDCTLDFRALDF
ncbi:hypothetical protein Tco_0144857 [Tanacetum coccineum]